MKQKNGILLLVWLMAAMLLTGCGAKQAPETAPATTAALTVPETTAAPETTEATEPPLMFQVGSKAYVAEYMGKEDLTAWFPHFQSREFYHLVDAYEDLKAYPKTGDCLPVGEYPGEIDQGEAYVIDYTWADGTIWREYMLCDGLIFDGMLETEGCFVPIQDKIQIGEKEYDAICYGVEYVGEWLPEYTYRFFWLVDGAYEDVKDAPKVGNMLPCPDYPMDVGQGQVTVIDYRTKDGTLERRFYRTDGTLWRDMEVTEEFTVK